MKKPAIFIIHLQNPLQIVHVYEILQSASFFQKFHGPFNLMSIFLTFHRFYEKNLWKDVPILWLISKRFIIICTFTKICHLEVFFNKLSMCNFKTMQNDSVFIIFFKKCRSLLAEGTANTW